MSSTLSLHDLLHHIKSFYHFTTFSAISEAFYDTHSQNMASTYTANPSTYMNDINFAGYVYTPLLYCDCGLLASNNGS